ncbi:MAG: hypothetical protein J1F25_03465 [Prevotellaceae bacterium]|nr:hypothetical protein [Prevotellaceae bacterium]
MKKLFFTLALATCSLLASAQVVIPVQTGKGLVRKSNEKIVLNASSSAAPKKAASLDDTILWGYYLGGIDELDAVGIGAAATYYAGYFVPGDALLQGASINGVNLPVYTTANMTNVSIWISEDLETNVVEQSVKSETLQPLSYNAIALDEPYAIPEGGAFVGVKFTITRYASDGDGYPILCGGDAYTNSLILKFSNASGTQDWGDYSSQFGSFGMQLFCSDVTLSDRSAYFSTIDAPTSLPNATVTTPAVIVSDGSEPVQSIDYSVDINGTKTTNHIDLTTAIPAGFGQQGMVKITFTAPAEYGAYTANVTIDKVNGEDNGASKVTPVTGKVLSKIVPRYTVVEEFTGTGCGWCPRGWLGMEQLKETRENFIGIAFHKFNSSDPMYVANYYPTGSLGIEGAPGCAMDRKLRGIDPYYGSDESIFDDFDQLNALAPEVAVNVNALYNDNCTAVDVTADVEYLTNGGKYTVAFVLTADDLSGETTAWRQSNYYASYAKTGDPLIDQFCRGGIYGSTYVYLTFNDVMIGSSYSTNGANLTPALSTNEAAVGTIATTSYTVQMPTKATLKEAIDLEKVYAVALVIAPDGTIANAARVKVSGEASAIHHATTDADHTEVARYNAAGQRISTPQQGVNIILHRDGTTSKVLVK